MAQFLGYAALTPFASVPQPGLMKQVVAFVIYPRFQSLDLTGPYEVFDAAGEYECRVVSTESGPVTSSSGLTTYATHGISDLAPDQIDTVVVVGGDGVGDARSDTLLLDWVRTAATTARRVASVCSGALLLAEAGLLDGRRATTHWTYEERLRREHPGVTVDCDPIFIRDGRIWTSAGVTAGMDLAVALVEQDLGGEVANWIAREFVMFLRRPGGQSQFSVPVWSQQPSSDPIRTAIAAIQTDPGGRYGINDLARLSGLSPRHFQRRFTVELGVSPSRYVERIRVEAARRALTDAVEPVETIARRLGFGTAETMRCAFRRQIGVTPSGYRDRFAGVREY
jgi:transcriptional regulator GlxA family with amidase domain